jgi:hypothetical protein
MKDTYTIDEVADLLEHAEKFKIQLHSENTISDIEVLVKQEFLKLGGKKELFP